MTGGGAQTQATIYDLHAPTDFPHGLPAPSFQMIVFQPAAPVTLDTQRFLTGDDAATTLAFEDAKWSDSIPNLLRAKFVEAFENAGVLRIGDDRHQLASERVLVSDLRAFRTTSGTDAHAEISLMAKIVDLEGKILAGRAFRSTAPTRSTDAAGAAEALDRAFGQVTTELVTWALQVP
jgi:ABC-type uncharacterized transport system auxiliary subunit